MKDYKAIGTLDMLDLLRCPHCDSALARIDFDEERLIMCCESCGRLYPVVEGIAILCDDLRKNKNFETSVLSQFLGTRDDETDRRIRREIRRIEALRMDSSWERDDVKFWDEKYRDKWETRANYSLQNRFKEWRDRLWQRSPLAEKIRLSGDGMPPRIILDVGCGEGQNMGLFDGGFYIAVDMSLNALRLARHFNAKLFRNSLFILCPADRIPIKRHSVDILTCFGILHHCPEKEATLLPLRLLLKKGGYLVLHEPCERPSITPPFLKPKIVESPHEERINRARLKEVLVDSECLMMEESRSIFFGFSMRFLRRIVLSREWIFRLFMRMDRVFLDLFGWLHPAMTPGEIKGVWRIK